MPKHFDPATLRVDPVRALEVQSGDVISAANSAVMPDGRPHCQLVLTVAMLDEEHVTFSLLDATAGPYPDGQVASESVTYDTLDLVGRVRFET